MTAASDRPAARTGGSGDPPPLVVPRPTGPGPPGWFTTADRGGPIRGAGADVTRERAVPYEVVSAYTLVLGEVPGTDTADGADGADADTASRPEVSVHSTAEDAWRALDAGVRARCGMRPRPRREIDPDAVVRLADAWRAADPRARYWQVTAHRLPIMVPELACPAAPVTPARRPVPHEKYRSGMLNVH